MMNRVTTGFKNLGLLILLSVVFSDMMPGAIAAEKADKPAELAPPIQVDSLNLKLSGSNTIGANLAIKLSQGFLMQQGARSVSIKALNEANETQVSGHFEGISETAVIQVKAHGSGSGFKALKSEKADIGMSSRPINETENYGLMKTMGDMTRVSSEHVIGLDGLAIITHPDNPVESLSIQELADIFAGNIKNWQQVGGEDRAIKRFARDDKSGTYDTFAGLVLKPNGFKLAPAERFESNENLVDSVNKTPEGIGFTAFAFAAGNKVLAISADEELPPVKPTEFSIATEDYPLSRRLFLYGNVDKDDTIAEFIRFIQSDAGQEIVAESHFINKNISVNKPAIPGKAPAKYRQLVQDGVRLSMTFRLHQARSEMDNKSAKDLNRLISYLKQKEFGRLVLVGLSEKIQFGLEGDDIRRGYIRSKLLEYHLKKAGIRNIEIMSLGDAFPIANNEHEMGRRKNTRTEVWLVPNS